MSLVGPRPERPVFVEELSREIPLYPRRLRVRPGVTGWAQVKHKYDESIDDVRKKVQYDLYYIENMSLRMDMKIIFSTVSHMLMGKGH
jgi:lipopolysaccharide/colanic/teichoic acid biosynthesis glycosyltransferase